MTSRKFMYMNKNVFTFVSIGFRAFVKSAFLQNLCTFVIRCVLPTLFYPQLSGSDYNRQNFWTIFLMGFEPEKDISAARFQLSECKQRKSS